MVFYIGFASGCCRVPLQAHLLPIAAAFEMDPVEKALRVGGEREVAKKSEEDAGTIAGMSLSRFIDMFYRKAVCSATRCRYSL